jgi:hypothetical protein
MYLGKHSKMDDSVGERVTEALATKCQEGQIYQVTYAHGREVEGRLESFLESPAYSFGCWRHGFKIESLNAEGLHVTEFTNSGSLTYKDISEIRDGQNITLYRRMDS